MFSTHRENRCRAILLALPHNSSAKQGKSMRELLVTLKDSYSECKSNEAQVRAIQKDLKHLRETEEIVSDEGGGERTALRYRRAPQEHVSSRNTNLENLYQDLMQRGISPDLAADFLRRVQQPSSETYYDLPPEQFVAVSDTVRLIPKCPPDETLQQEIIKALRQSCVLKASYRKLGRAKPDERRLHLLGVLLRGPQHYLIAFDEKDLNLPKPQEKMFLLLRLEDAIALVNEPARLPAHVTVASLMRAKGLADFVRDTGAIKLQLRVWDYALRLLEDYKIAPNQTILHDSDRNSAIVTATVWQSGTLFRWLLGFGDKVEVLQPQSLRSAIAWAAYNATNHYEDAYEDDVDSEEKDGAGGADDSA